METTPKPPGSLTELILGWIQNHVGIKGVFLFLLLGATGSALWNWESISSHPIYEEFRVAYFSAPLPKVEPGAISILVANLHGDIGHKFGQSLTSELIPENLPVGNSPIHIYKLDRYIGGTSNEVFQEIQEGRAKAREFLKQTKADLLVWGRLEGTEKSQKPLIFVTASGDGYSKVNVGTDVRIPGTEKTDMLKLLRVVALTEWAQLEKDDGTAINDGFINQIITTFNALQLFSKETGVAKLEAETIVARSKARIGRAYDNPQLLEQALASLQSVAMTPALDASIKTDVELGLGLSHFSLADVNPGRYNHQDALSHYQAAWKLIEGSNDTRRQAQALIGIAGGHLALYQKNQREEQLNSAVAQVQKALELIDKTQYAGDWCRAAQTLAVANRSLGEIRRDPALVQQSIVALEAVLALRSKKLVPVFWANTKNSLGNAWSTKAALTGAGPDYVSAMDHYRGALEVFDAKRFPLMYATVTMNLALVEENHWRLTHDATYQQRAMEHYQVAKSVFQLLNQGDRLQQAASGIARLEQTAPAAAVEPASSQNAAEASSDKVEKVAKGELSLHDKIEAAMRKEKIPLDKAESSITRGARDRAEMSHKMWSELKSSRPHEKLEAPKK